MTAAGVLRRWLLRPSGTTAARGFVFMMLLWGPIGLAGGIYDLVSGNVRGGRPTGLLLMAYSALATALLVRLWQRSSKVWHVLAGALLLTPLRWVDSWLYDPRTQWRFPLVPVLIALALAYNLARFARAGRSQVLAPTSAPGPDATSRMSS